MPCATSDVTEDRVEEGPATPHASSNVTSTPCLRANLSNPARQNAGATKRPGTPIPLLGVEYYDIYGLTEVYGPGIGINCQHGHGMHIWSDYVFVEIIDPETGEVLPDGEWGEIVLTTLVKEGAPLIRFRTHDLSRIIPGECECGHNEHPRIDTITGRSDDMMKIHGVNVFPAQIEEILSTFPELSSEYQIRLSHLDGRDWMRIYVETNGSVDWADMSKAVARRVRERIGFTPLVKIVELGMLPRSEKKTKRVFDERYE